MHYQYENLATEKTNLSTEHIDECDALGIVTCINRQDKLVAQAVEAVLPQIAKAVEAIERSFYAGGRLIYLGAGTSGRLGVLDASECPPTFGTDPRQVQGYIAGGDQALRSAVEGCEDDGDAGKALIRQLEIGLHDVVVGISASGSAAYVIEAIRQAKSQGAVTVGVVTNENSRLEQECDITIAPLVGPEAITGSTRMKSGTAQKMVLNMLSTAAMIRTGKVYGNLMVDVQANNRKLEDRALRIVMQVTQLERAECRKALEAAGMNAKKAILLLKTGEDIQGVEKRLEKAGGHLRKALLGEQ